MKQNKLIQAYKATEVLSSLDKLDVTTLWNVYKLRKILAPHWEFQLEREKAIQTKDAEFIDSEGKISGQHYIDYLSELEEVSNIDKDIEETTKIKIELQDNMGITVHTIEALEDFVEFVLPEK